MEMSSRCSITSAPSALRKSAIRSKRRINADRNQVKIASPLSPKRARIEIIPLIDIMFFLLASFMMVSLSQTHMKGIRVNLPAAVGPPPSGVKDYVSIRVGAGNTVSFDGQLVNDDDVLPR